MANLNNHTSDCRLYSIENLSLNSSCRDILRSIIDLTECKIDSVKSQDLRKLADFYTNNKHKTAIQMIVIYTGLH